MNVGSYAYVRACGATHAEIVDAHAAGIDLEEYANAFRSWSAITHAEIMDAHAAGANLDGYGSARHWGDVDHTRALEIHALDIDLDVYARAITSGATHAEVMDAHAAGANLSIYATARYIGIGHTEAIEAHIAGLDDLVAEPPARDIRMALKGGATYAEVLVAARNDVHSRAPLAHALDSPLPSAEGVGSGDSTFLCTEVGTEDLTVGKKEPIGEGGGDIDQHSDEGLWCSLSTWWKEPDMFVRDGWRYCVYDNVTVPPRCCLADASALAAFEMDHWCNEDNKYPVRVTMDLCRLDDDGRPDMGSMRYLEVRIKSGSESCTVTERTGGSFNDLYAALIEDSDGRVVPMVRPVKSDPF